MGKTVFFSVGEPSGDQHAARLIECLGQMDGSITTRGFGGSSMRAAGCHIDVDLTEHAVVGLLEVLPKLRQFFGFADQAESLFQSGNIDAVMLVDFPGFNWHIAKRAKRYGIPVHYYCPPQLWAWAPWRIRKMRRTVDHVLSVLPFEHEYFAARGLDSTFVGHPFFDAVAEKSLDPPTLGSLNEQAEQGAKLVAVLPGSRNHEVHQNWPLMLQSIRQLHRQHPEAVFLVAAYRKQQLDWCRGQMNEQDEQLPIHFFVDRTSEIIEVARCAMMVSGSVSLELMTRRTPAAVIYRVGRFLHAVGRRMIQIDSLSLPNLMAKRNLFPEFVSVGAPDPAVEFLTASVGAMLSDEFYYQGLLRDLDRLCEKFATPGATDRAARILLSRLQGDPLPVSIDQDDDEGRFQLRRAA